MWHIIKVFLNDVCHIATLPHCQSCLWCLNDCWKNMCMYIVVFLCINVSTYWCINTFIHPYTTKKHLKYPKHLQNCLLTITYVCVPHSTTLAKHLENLYWYRTHNLPFAMMSLLIHTHCVQHFFVVHVLQICQRQIGGFVLKLQLFRPSTQWDKGKREGHNMES